MKPGKPIRAIRTLERAIVAMKDSITDDAGQILLPGVDAAARLNALSMGLESLNQRLKQEIRETMAARDLQRMSGETFACTLRISQRATIDLQRLKDEHPRLVRQYTTQTEQRALVFAANKGV